MNTSSGRQAVNTRQSTAEGQITVSTLCSSTASSCSNIAVSYDIYGSSRKPTHLLASHCEDSLISAAILRVDQQLLQSYDASASLFAKLATCPACCCRRSLKRSCSFRAFSRLAALQACRRASICNMRAPPESCMMPADNKSWGFETRLNIWACISRRRGLHPFSTFSSRKHLSRFHFCWLQTPQNFAMERSLWQSRNANICCTQTLPFVGQVQGTE